MAMVRVEVLGAIERRRRHHEHKVWIVKENFAAGVTVTDVARRNGVAASLIFTWRRQAKLGQLGGASPAPLLLPVELAPVVTESRPRRCPRSPSRSPRAGAVGGLASSRSRSARAAGRARDFGDNWEHTLKIEAIGDADPGLDYPRFVDGARRALAEDVGGIPGFEEFVHTMAKPRHPECKRLIEWYGRIFDPKDVDLPIIKANIAKLARGRAIGKAAFAQSLQSES